MSCNICARNPIIGQHYRLQAGSCPCGYPFSGVDHSTYKGMMENLHIFRLHPKKVCPACEITFRYASYTCENMINVTKEFSENLWQYIGRKLEEE